MTGEVGSDGVCLGVSAVEGTMQDDGVVLGDSAVEGIIIGDSGVNVTDTFKRDICDVGEIGTNAATS